MNIIQRLWNKGFWDSAKAITRRMSQSVIARIGDMQAIAALKKANFEIVFPIEGNITLAVPRTSYLKYCFGGRRRARQTPEFVARPNKEALLRYVVYRLFDSGFLDRSKSVIDIGCWLSDNTIVWSKLLDHGGVVHAIDPSVENINFGKRVAALNGVTNVNWVHAVCSDRSRVALDFAGAITHAKFVEADNTTSKGMQSTTLDEVVNRSEHQAISLIHVDVEGFEEKVLRGAEGIIKRDKPVIIYEQHISSEDTAPIRKFLRDLDYVIFMVNEVPPGCSPDCRNLVAFSRSRPVPDMNAIDGTADGLKDIISAAVGPALLPVD